MEINYRTFRENDTEGLRSLMLELGYLIEPEEFMTTIEELHKQNDLIFIAEAGGKIIGSSSVIIDVRLAEGICGEIASLVVSEDFRGRGVGTELIRLSEKHLSKHVDTMRIRANVTRQNSHSYYTSQGYREIKEQKVFIKPLRPDDRNTIR